MLCDDTITSYCTHANVFCFNGFNQAVIVLRYSAHIKPRKTIKTIRFFDDRLEGWGVAQGITD